MENDDLYVLQDLLLLAEVLYEKNATSLTEILGLFDADAKEELDRLLG
ncbi:hypothetical protein Q0N71_06080 [Bacillus thuringiensis]